MWVKGVVDRFYFVAKVSAKPGMHGINNGRVFKLNVCVGKAWNGNRQVYNYDRDLEFDGLPDGILDRILANIEQIAPAPAA